MSYKFQNMFYDKNGVINSYNSLVGSISYYKQALPPNIYNLKIQLLELMRQFIFDEIDYDDYVISVKNVDNKIPIEYKYV